MRTIAHIIHPVVVPTDSRLHFAQKVTIATMQAARAFAQGRVEVRHFAVKYHDEAPAIPNDFELTPDLTRSVYDKGKFKERRKLAILKDILDRLAAAAQSADYLIYTNADIALQPHFYLGVDQLLDEGYDALIVNRRTISARYKTVRELPLMYAELGENHPGRDCFVFKRETYSKYELGDICIGTKHIGEAMALNLVYHATRFQNVPNLHLTFHLGDDRVWREHRYREYVQHNNAELREIFQRLRTAHPDLTHELISDVENRLARRRPDPQPGTLGRILKKFRR